MRSLYAAMALGFVLSAVTGCSGNGLPPVTSATAARKMDTHRPVRPADCPSPNDTGGIMTGDGSGC